MSAYHQRIGEYGEHEFVGKDGYRALICLVVVTDVYWYGERQEEKHTINPAEAEVWPCVARPFGHCAYATDPLTGDALQAWLTKYHDELVELAFDFAADAAEAADERRRER
jgi:hypothetical protein